MKMEFSRRLFQIEGILDLGPSQPCGALLPVGSLLHEHPGQQPIIRHHFGAAGIVKSIILWVVQSGDHGIQSLTHLAWAIRVTELDDLVCYTRTLPIPVCHSYLIEESLDILSLGLGR